VVKVFRCLRGWNTGYGNLKGERGTMDPGVDDILEAADSGGWRLE